MSILDEIAASFGSEALESMGNRATYDRWCEVCVCGHLDVHHGVDIGGSWNRDIGPMTHPRDGTEWAQFRELDGCAGAVQRRVPVTPVMDEEAHAMVYRVEPTCPCLKFQPLAKVNRPNRAFNQRLPADRSNHARHPFITGVRAFTTHLSKRKDADPERGGSPEWATAEFDRRFTWLDGARTCSISRCTTADATVWPCFVNGEALSELRCGAHRPT